MLLGNINHIKWKGGTNRGRGYTSLPTITFTAAPSGGTTATATARLESGVESVRITDMGSGYTAGSPPTVTFSASLNPAGTAAGTAGAADSRPVSDDHGPGGWLPVGPHRDLFGAGQRDHRDRRRGDGGGQRLRSVPEPVLGAPNAGRQTASGAGSGRVMESAPACGMPR